MFRGESYGHIRVKDGTEVYTDYIKLVVDRHDMILATGHSGRQYMLWKDRHHKKKKDVEI